MEKKRKVRFHTPIDPTPLRPTALRQMMLAVETSELIWHIDFFPRPFYNTPSCYVPRRRIISRTSKHPKGRVNSHGMAKGRAAGKKQKWLNGAFIVRASLIAVACISCGIFGYTLAVTYGDVRPSSMIKIQ